MDNLLLNLFNSGADTLSPQVSILLAILLLVSIGIKGVALYHAARIDEKPWFIALLFVNTFGILELVYLFFFSKTKLTPAKVKADLDKLIARKK